LGGKRGLPYGSSGFLVCRNPGTAPGGLGLNENLGEEKERQKSRSAQKKGDGFSIAVFGIVGGEKKKGEDWGATALGGRKGQN